MWGMYFDIVVPVAAAFAASGATLAVVSVVKSRRAKGLA
jgi:hypothetical protein